MQRIDSFRGPYYFLSNFYPARIVFEDMQFLCAEAAFQAAKTTNLELRRPFTLMGGTTAKHAGRQLVLRPNWNTIRIDVMRKIVEDKFFHNPALAKALLATGTAELIEGNTWGDTFWGVCNGVGKNVLGTILMGVRGQLHFADNPKRPRCYE